MEKNWHMSEGHTPFYQFDSKPSCHPEMMAAGLPQTTCLTCLAPAGLSRNPRQLKGPELSGGGGHGETMEPAFGIALQAPRICYPYFLSFLFEPFNVFSFDFY